jgi:hypothetical protein
MMTPDPDTLHAIADWVRVTKAHVISITCYDAPVSVLVDVATFRRAFAGVVVTLERGWARSADDRMTSPDMGGWHVCAIDREARGPEHREQVTL